MLVDDCNKYKKNCQSVLRHVQLLLFDKFSAFPTCSVSLHLSKPKETDFPWAFIDMERFEREEKPLIAKDQASRNIQDRLSNSTEYLAGPGRTLLQQSIHDRTNACRS